MIVSPPTPTDPLNQGLGIIKEWELKETKLRHLQVLIIPILKVNAEQKDIEPKNSSLT
jgi:hypothetical protein